jgi:alkanesulfonate monooxygenase SsuD/methylene tetrahydromethanopterin reductase-like flavin-dependent oxidoreductase (luciferase family)
MISFDLPPESEMLEGYSTLSYLAHITSRVTLGPLVVGAIYRHPGILIKTASTLDVLSGGHARSGIGAGWYERESRVLGVPFPPVAERFARLEEVRQRRAGACRTPPAQGSPRPYVASAG